MQGRYLDHFLVLACRGGDAQEVGEPLGCQGEGTHVPITEQERGGGQGQALANKSPAGTVGAELRRNLPQAGAPRTPLQPRSPPAQPGQFPARCRCPCWSRSVPHCLGLPTTSASVPGQPLLWTSPWGGQSSGNQENHIPEPGAPRTPMPLRPEDLTRSAFPLGPQPCSGHLRPHGPARVAQTGVSPDRAAPGTQPP